MYKISPASYKLAKIYIVDIIPSTKTNRKVEVYRDGVYLASIEDSRYMDYHLWLKEIGKAYADARKRLFYMRHNKETFKLKLAKLLLWDGVIGSTLGVGAMGPHHARGKTMEHRRPEGVARGQRCSMVFPRA